MKKLEIIIRPEKLDTLKDILTENHITGMMITNIMGFGNQMGHTQQYRSVKYSVNLVLKLRVETVVRDEAVAGLVAAVTSKLATGRVGDGKIFISPVENAVRIRTGESGEKAL
ncbi:MAG: P-II family nitrogen regulator [Fusobacteriaceae bacterium]|nr:P-II family nitrogen regulator [Fusobacteriaceae bacterium]